jgi:hypothetical protein
MPHRSLNMPTVPDDLEKLLSDVRKSIDDNRQFLKALSADAVEESGESEVEDGKDADEFEEL